MMGLGGQELLILSVFLIFALLGMKAQYDRGGSLVMGFIVGLFLGPIGVLVAMYSGGRRCEACRKYGIPRGATKCARCGTAVAARVLVLALLLTGCAHGPLATLPAVDPDRAAEIVVIRPSGFVGCGSSVPITVDGQKIHALACGEHVVFVVPAGERIIGSISRTWIVEDENTTVVMAVARQRHYLRLDVAGLGVLALNRITADVGERLIATTARQ